MSMTDPLADMMAQIMNGQAARKKEISLPASKIKIAVTQVLKNEGYIEDNKIIEVEGKIRLVIVLKYYNGIPVISMLKRVSKPGCRKYKSKENVPIVLGGLGISIMTTSNGVMSDKQAHAIGSGGEVLCLVS